MKLVVIGTGYVGLVAGACFARFGNEVCCVDKDESKLEILRTGRAPFYEPDLDMIIEENVREGRLSFSANIADVIDGADVCVIAVGTPSGDGGNVDMSYVDEAAREIGSHIGEYKLVVTKSTVPVGTAARIRDIIGQELEKRGTNVEFDVASNPEFLREGAAVRDFIEPERLIFGVDGERGESALRSLYSFVQSDRFIAMDIASAEMTKYAANAMLATRISFMNEMADICERVGADVEFVRLGMGTDSRIGRQFLNAGCGFGGSCFPKDVRALREFAKAAGHDSLILSAVERVNEKQKKVLFKKISAYFEDASLADKTIGVWGLSFKPQTSDVREAPSLSLIESLVAAGARVQAHDPQAIDDARGALGDLRNMIYVDNPYDAANGADALVLVTEWDIYKQPDFARIKTLMKTPVIFDGRNLYNRKQLKKLGFAHYSIGRA